MTTSTANRNTWTSVQARTEHAAPRPVLTDRHDLTWARRALRGLRGNLRTAQTHQLEVAVYESKIRELVAEFPALQEDTPSPV